MLLPDQPAQRPAKRLRPSLESKTLPQVIEMLNDLIPVRSFSGEMVVLEDEVL
jgi:serine/threonine-protein kinase ATR